jgi:hypothetical protein
MFDQLSAEIVPNLTKGRHNSNSNNKTTTKQNVYPAVHCVYSRVKIILNLASPGVDPLSLGFETMPRTEAYIIK